MEQFKCHIVRQRHGDAFQRTVLAIAERRIAAQSIRAADVFQEIAIVTGLSVSSPSLPVQLGGTTVCDQMIDKSGSLPAVSPAPLQKRAYRRASAT